MANNLDNIIYLSDEKFNSLINNELAGKVYDPNANLYFVPDDSASKSYTDAQLATKLNKSTAKNIIYSNDDNGNPATIPYSYDVFAYTVPVRHAGGALLVGTPTIDSHAATKGYVDGAIGGVTSSLSSYVTIATEQNITGTKTFSNISVTGWKSTGTATKPVYFDTNGKPAACTYELKSTVPENAVFTDTTYTFTEGSTNGAFSVTPAGGSASSVKVHGLGTAAYKADTYFATATHTHSEYAGAMHFKGTLGSNGTISSLPAASTDNTGFTYVVITAGTYAGTAAKIGDTFISNGTVWTLIPSGDEPSGTVTNVAVGVGLVTASGSAITSTGTIKAALTTETNDTYAAVSKPASNSSKIYPVIPDKNGKLSVIVPWSDTDNDTKNTAGSTDTSSKIYLIGAATQAANPQTYSDNEVYVTSGVMTTKSVQVGGGSATMQYNTSSGCLEIIC